MNRDEAWQDYRCERSVYRNALAINVGVDIAAQRLDLAVEAVAAACVAEALPGPLELLERLAREGDDPRWHGLEVNFCPATGNYTYFSYHGEYPEFTRTEALALLAGKGDTHDA